MSHQIPTATHPVLGIDYSLARPDPACLASRGIKFVSRYLSPPGGIAKDLSREEANALSKAGIMIVANWESYADRAKRGAYAGAADAVDAARMAKEYGMPDDRPIYFSIDFDARGEDLTYAMAYLIGAANKIGVERVGVYGGYRVIEAACEGNRARWFWQTYAWSTYTNEVRWHPACHVQQYRNHRTMCGGSVDYNRAIDGDIGAWFSVDVIPPPQPPPTEEGDPMYLSKLTEDVPEFQLGAGAFIAGNIVVGGYHIGDTPGDSEEVFSQFACFDMIKRIPVTTWGQVSGINAADFRRFYGRRAM